MMQLSALATIEALIEARKNKDFETAFGFYESEATVVLQPGESATGVETIKAFIRQASSLSITFTKHEIVESGNLALHLCQYTLDMGENGLVNGRTADVLRRQADGKWLIAIDNAWAGI